MSSLVLGLLIITFHYFNLICMKTYRANTLFFIQKNCILLKMAGPSKNQSTNPGKNRKLENVNRSNPGVSRQRWGLMKKIIESLTLIRHRKNGYKGGEFLPG
jgi:hypothetical protein